MAVVPMEKVRLLVHKNEVDAALQVLQQKRAVSFEPIEALAVTETTPQFEHADLLALVQPAVEFLTPYAAKKGMWRTLREGSLEELTETQVEQQLKNIDVVAAIVADVEAVQVEFADKNEEARRLTENLASLNAWKALPVRLANLHTETTKILLVAGAVSDQAVFDRVYAALAETSIAFELLAISDTQVAVIVETAAADSQSLRVALDAAAVSVVAAPTGVETPEIEITRVEEELAAVEGQIAQLHDQAEHVAHTHLRQLKIADEILSWQRDRYAIVNDAAVTASTVVFSGWLNANKRARIETAFAEVAPTAVLETVPLADGEEPPVDIHNNRIIRPFEVVTRLYGMPGHRDLDPTAFLAAFFFLFFGLSLTDVGYGVALVFVSGFLLAFAKLRQTTRNFMKLLFYVGVSTVVVGMFFGGYFGIPPEALPPMLQAVQQFDPIGNPLPVFYLALSLGVFQVIVGLILKIYSEARQGRLLDGILDQGPWLFLFGLGILYILQMVGWVAVLSTDRLVILAYLGVAVLIVTAARHGKGIFDMVMKAAGSLYGSVGYLSDILSYSRLLALGLATTALAFAVNLIAEIVSGTAPIIGPFFALVILIIGHVFTLAVNTLGAFIHSARLQFVEFFGKFIDGTGREFKPLARSERYVSVTKD